MDKTRKLRTLPPESQDRGEQKGALEKRHCRLGNQGRGTVGQIQKPQKEEETSPGLEGKES